MSKTEPFDFATGLRPDGKYEISWDPNDKVSTRRAHAAFNALRSKGYLVYPCPTNGRFSNIRGCGSFIAEACKELAKYGYEYGDPSLDPPMLEGFEPGFVEFKLEVTPVEDVVGMFLVTSVAEHYDEHKGCLIRRQGKLDRLSGHHERRHRHLVTDRGAPLYRRGKNRSVVCLLDLARWSLEVHGTLLSQAV